MQSQNLLTMQVTRDNHACNSNSSCLVITVAHKCISACSACIARQISHSAVCYMQESVSQTQNKQFFGCCLLVRSRKTVFITIKIFLILLSVKPSSDINIIRQTVRAMPKQHYLLQILYIVFAVINFNVTVRYDNKIYHS